MSVIITVEQLEALYGLPGETCWSRISTTSFPNTPPSSKPRLLPRSRPAGRKGWIARRAAISPASSASVIRKP